jgi:hypothetical protein
MAHYLIRRAEFAVKLNHLIRISVRPSKGGAIISTYRGFPDAHRLYQSPSGD